MCFEFEFSIDIDRYLSLGLESCGNVSYIICKFATALLTTAQHRDEGSENLHRRRPDSFFSKSPLANHGTSTQFQQPWPRSDDRPGENGYLTEYFSYTGSFFIEWPETETTRILEYDQRIGHCMPKSSDRIFEVNDAGRSRRPHIAIQGDERRQLPASLLNCHE